MVWTTVIEGLGGGRGVCGASAIGRPYPAKAGVNTPKKLMAGAIGNGYLVNINDV